MARQHLVTVGEIDTTAIDSEGITMYGADWCGDCRRAKSFLERNDVAYTYVDLVEHPLLIEEVLERNDGARSIPVIVFSDGSHLTEPSDADLATKLGIGG